MRSEKIMNVKEDSIKKSTSVAVNDNRVGSAELIIDSNAGFIEGKEVDAKLAERVYDEIINKINPNKEVIIPNSTIGKILDEIEATHDVNKKASSDSLEVKRKKILEIVRKIREVKKIPKAEEAIQKGKVYDFGKLFETPLTKEELMKQVDILKRQAMELTGDISGSDGSVDGGKAYELNKLTYGRIGAVINAWQEMRKKEAEFDEDVDVKINELKSFQHLLEVHAEALCFEIDPKDQIQGTFEEPEEKKPEEDIDPWHYQE